QHCLPIACNWTNLQNRKQHQKRDIAEIGSQMRRSDRMSLNRSQDRRMDSVRKTLSPLRVTWRERSRTAADGKRKNTMNRKLSRVACHVCKRKEERKRR